MDEELDEWVDRNQVARAAVTDGGFGRGGEKREEVVLCWAGLLVSSTRQIQSTPVPHLKGPPAFPLPRQASPSAEAALLSLINNP